MTAHTQPADNATQAENSCRFERPSETCKRFGGMGISTLYAHIDRGLFPKPIALSRRFVVFPSDEVDAIINARTAGKSDDDVRQLVCEIMDARKNRA